MSNTKFPYKYLIITLGILGAMYIFKPQVGSIISKTEKIKVLGFELEVNKTSMKSFKKVTDSLNSIIKDRNQKIKIAKIKHDSLHKKLEELKIETENCGDSDELVIEIEDGLNSIERINESLKQDSQIIYDVLD